jgi:homoaconitase/3-isopropylmalate dehydratase large subunit
MDRARRLDSIWEEHLDSAESDDAPAVLHVDLHLVHEVTSPQALRRAARAIAARPARTETIGASALEPMITWGTSPGMGMRCGRWPWRFSS